MRACSTDDICTHATCMLHTSTMEIKSFLVPLFYCPCLKQRQIRTSSGPIWVPFTYPNLFGRCKSIAPEIWRLLFDSACLHLHLHFGARLSPPADCRARSWVYRAESGR